MTRVPDIKRLGDTISRSGIYGYTADQMREYAALVRADEREACAKVCDELVAHRTQSHCDSEAFGAEDCAKAIRARGNT